MRDTLPAFIARLGLTMTVRPAKTNPHMPDLARHWRCTLRGPNAATLRTPFSQGSAHTKPPTIEEVLNCLADDAASVDQDFEDWCRDVGESTDSRRAERTYMALCASRDDLRRFLDPDDYEMLLWDTERQ